ncbi:retrovirus-related pol polyprotein from transposon TNT 1-94 [Tanacetum coccineum]|uniref:Retrovirus-related pol polyprotein from transposon TNT 1-94 n=1 Tax=Tanacetum coccineum TaxID=301880 RepID=A0ABQ5CV14_9ASTR
MYVFNPLALVAQQQPVYHPQNHPNHYTQNSSTKSQPAATKNKGKAIVNSPPPTYNQEPTMVAEDDEMSKEKEIDKLMALISLSFKKIYKPANNNLRTSSNTSRANQDNTLRNNRGTGYDNQRAVNVVGARENVEMKKEPFAHQETISIMSQEKEAQKKFHKTREDKELEKVIALENKIKILDDIVYKISQSVQTMNMLNRNCETSFVKLEFLKKAQRANPRLYDIGCYNDNLALMLAPESDETIRLAQESRSKLSDLIKPFDYKNLNNLYDLFVPQREKSPEQRYFSERSKISHTPVKNENSKESFNKQTTLLEKRMDESIPFDQKCKSSKEIFKIKSSVDTIFDGVKRCKQTIAKRTYFGHKDPFIQNTIERNFCPQIRKINADLEKFHLCLKEEMVADLRYFNSLEHELIEIILFIVDSRCSKHMTGNLKLLSNFVEKFLGTMKFKNDQIAPILGYGDLVHDGTALSPSLNQDPLTPNPISKYAKIFNPSQSNEGIEHQTSTARTLEQNGVVERQNRTLIEAARTMLSAAKVPLFFWAETIAIACFTQNRSLIIPQHDKTPYHIINGWKPSVKFFYIFSSLCYIVGDGENLYKMKEQGDACIFLASDHASSDPVPQCPTTVLKHASLSPDPQSQENVPHATETVTTSNELDLLFSPMFDELLNGTTPIVSKSSDVHVVDARNTGNNTIQQPSNFKTKTRCCRYTPLNIQTTPETTNQAPTITAIKNINQAETDKENAQV